MLRAFRNRRLPLALAALFAASGLGADWHAVSHDHVETELHAAIAEPIGDHVERPESVGHGTPATPPCFFHGVAAESFARPDGSGAVLLASSEAEFGEQSSPRRAPAWRLAPKQSPPTTA